MTVRVDVANVRAGPSLQHAVLMQLRRGSEVTARQLREDWIEIDTGRNSAATGWIHADLLVPDPAQENQNAAGTAGPEDPLFGLFRRAFEELQERTRAQTGRTYFGAVRYHGNRVVRLTVTEDWATLDRPEREQHLDEIFTLWDAAIGDGVPITVDIIDSDGNRLVSRFK